MDLGRFDKSRDSKDAAEVVAKLTTDLISPADLAIRLRPEGGRGDPGSLQNINTEMHMSTPEAQDDTCRLKMC